MFASALQAARARDMVCLAGTPSFLRAGGGEGGGGDGGGGARGMPPAALNFEASNYVVSDVVELVG